MLFPEKDPSNVHHLFTELLESIESGAAGASRSAPGSPKNQNGDVRNRKRVPSPNRTPECSPEHLEVVKRISKCKNYYEVLEVDKENFNENELKKKYRKLALLVSARIAFKLRFGEASNDHSVMDPFASKLLAMN